MENNLPQKEQTTPSQNTKRLVNKKLFIAVGCVIIALILIFLLLTFGTKSKIQNKNKIAPLVENIGNPLNVKVSLGFSTTNLSAKVNQPVKVDVNMQTLEEEGITGGTVILKYDLNFIKNAKIELTSGPTGLLPIGTTFSKVIYNPNNISFSFQLPAGAIPVTGKGRIAQLTFTPAFYQKESTTQITYDLPNSNIYLESGGTKTKLKLSQAALDLDIESAN